MDPSSITARLHLIDKFYTEKCEELERVKRITAALKEKGICNGSEYWRELPSGAKSLYANHATNTACPVHGPPAPDQSRLRTYIGTDDLKIEDCRDQMQRYRQFQEFERKRKNLIHAVRITDRGTDHLLQTARMGY